MTKEDIEYYRSGMNQLYHIYLDDIKANRIESVIYTVFLNSQSPRYLKVTDARRKVIDFIAGMTDDMFIREVKRVLR